MSEPNNIHEFDTVKTNSKLNIGIMNAFKGAFDLGVKYTKEIIITVTTAEMMIMVDVGMGAVEKIIQRLKNIKELEPIAEWISKFLDYKLKFVDSDLEMVKYLGYVYLMKSYKEYSDALKTSDIPTSENQIEHFNEFMKMITSMNPGIAQNISSARDVINKQNTLTTNPKHTTQPPTKDTHHRGGSSNTSNDALKIANRIIDDILLLPLHLQLDEMVKIIDKLKKFSETKKMIGGMVGKKTGKKLRRRRNIKRTIKMIRNSLRSFS